MDNASKSFRLFLVRHWRTFGCALNVGTKLVLKVQLPAILNHAEQVCKLLGWPAAVEEKRQQTGLDMAL